MVRRLCFALLTALLLTAAPVFSDDDAYLRLSRISYLEGDVSTQRLPDVDWSAASINMPLEPGDRIYTGRNGRLEIEFDDDSVLRLAENTDIEILSLDERIVQVRMLLGLATLTVASGVDFEINTPAAAFNAVSKGSYRFEVNEDGDTDAIVRKGRIEAANNAFARAVESGTRLHVRAGGEALYSVARYEERDAWDEWNDRRTVDRRAYASRRYLPSTVYIGAADLDRYGRWVNVSNYGWAWVPYSVDVYWSPYSVGRWCYRPRFGWTWVSYEPWGWLPYHYGRWHQSSSFGWVWLPGPSFSFNFWSPGLVAFYSGPTWVSWLPLGPRDYYNVKHYHYNRGIYSHQLAQLRGLHTRAPGDHFNRSARGAVRTVHVDQFRNGSFHERSASTRWGNIDRPWQEGTLRDGIDVRPTRASYRPAPEREFARPENRRERPVVVRNEPRRDARDGADRERFRPITRPEFRDRVDEARGLTAPAARDGGIDRSARDGSVRGGAPGNAARPDRGDDRPAARSADREPGGTAGREESGRWRTERQPPDRSVQIEAEARRESPREAGREVEAAGPRGADRDEARAGARAERPEAGPTAAPANRAAPEPRSERSTSRWRAESGAPTSPAPRVESPAARPQAVPRTAEPRTDQPAERTVTRPQTAPRTAEPRTLAPRDSGSTGQARRVQRSVAPSRSLSGEGPARNGGSPARSGGSSVRSSGGSGRSLSGGSSPGRSGASGGSGSSGGSGRSGSGGRRR
jgi:hypothetical protein